MRIPELFMLKENGVTIAHELGSMSSCSGQCAVRDPHSGVALSALLGVLSMSKCWQPKPSDTIRLTYQRPNKACKVMYCDSVKYVKRSKISLLSLYIGQLTVTMSVSSRSSIIF
jgi:hypothetical protein